MRTPQTHAPFVTPLQHGVPIRDYLTSDEETKLKLSEIGMHAVFKMVFMDNFVHADLHPGNMLVTHNKETNDPQLVILDGTSVYAQCCSTRV